VCQYSSSSLVGALTLQAHHTLRNTPLYLDVETGAINSILLKRRVCLSHSYFLFHLFMLAFQEWLQEVQKWLAEPLHQQEHMSAHQLYRLVVCEDMTFIDATLKRVCTSHQLQIEIVDCHIRDVEVELAHYFGTKGFLYISILPIFHIKVYAFIEDTKKVHGPVTSVFVVLNAHLLSEYHRLHVASYTSSAGYRLILVMPSFNPETLTLRIKLPSSIRMLYVCPLNVLNIQSVYLPLISINRVVCGDQLQSGNKSKRVT
jgi:hypothetical protein